MVDSRDVRGEREEAREGPGGGGLTVAEFRVRLQEAVGRGADLNRACALHDAIGQGLGVDFLTVLLQHGCVSG